MTQAMNSPWLSILIPVYNVQDYLQECFDSVLSQIDSGVEIIALDDQSTDASYAVLKSIVENSSYPVKILRHEKNRGLSAARNSMIEVSTGDYLWFLDSDDTLVFGAVTKLKKIIDEHNPDLIMCDYEVWREKPLADVRKRLRDRHIASFGGQPGVLSRDNLALFAGLYEKGKLHAWSKISKRHFWNEGLQFPEGRYFEDMIATPKLALKVNTYFYVPDVWVRYRRREGSILTSGSLKKIDDLAAGMNDVLNEWTKAYPLMNDRVKFPFFLHAFRIYLYVKKELNRIGQGNSQLLRKYKKMTYDSIMITKKELIMAFIKQKMFLKAIKIAIML
jgi:glycosyltransferase involved in cell wall biosynthesis